MNKDQLQRDVKLDIHQILDKLEDYKPKRRGWVWRTPKPLYKMHSFEYKDMSESLKQGVPLPSAKYFDNIDPQGTSTITTEIASGRFEDDIRRMRMAAWHGADHIMVIRTAGQSHFDGLIEGTPQGVGGIPITRKQVRAQRKALDMIEEEVGRPINYHSYISGIAGPEIAVMFAEEGVNGAHQDPQYNVLYRNINMVRSFVDACEAKKVMAWADIAQIDGAHNANATAREAWKVMPELMVQHAINTAFSYKVGIEPSNICLSTVPPTAPPAPSMYLDLPYAVALREFFADFRMRAQQNTKYMEASTREATVTHTLNLLISKLTSADIQSTITPDEGRNVPWHIYNIEAVDTAKQVFQGLDGFNEMVQLKDEGPLREKARELKERAVLFMEAIVEQGGYFNAVENTMFVDSGNYPERNEDGIKREINGGIGAGTIYKRDEDYLAPVTAHFGYNNVAQYNESAVEDPSKLIKGSTLEDHSKIVYIDELDENDNVNLRLEETKKYREEGLIHPEAEWKGDGIILLTFMLPESKRVAEFAALEIGKKMGLEECEVINTEVLQYAEGTRIEMKGRLSFAINKETLIVPEEPEVLTDDEIMADIKRKGMTLVAGTVGEDEHSVGLREIIDIKHGGIEKYGIKVHYLGTSVPVEKMVDAAIELNADGILASTIISHDDIHYKNMKRINDLAIEKGIRDRIILAAGGTQVIPEIGLKNGMDAAFGRGSKGVDVATALVEKRWQMEKEN
ncbi:cobalamin B12-binding domain-containing protein [Facklamia sp. DSM 111018]|uniref:Cobalamin B12-binding domain-containing protein n=1 Tax=Facklamia lactis TaxID=2749967 RepID=A0ABS0LP38_9LACT|nr:D-ornithine 4,5-aminomutase subunit OraE [Facklamia lactis]MBG9980123.1 cobalamin B12-binding domain-containing protein [Facklamia lactis]MBG9985925.1 cobalamin B12-binding domain-containing protein [Facklamia lactis]